MKATKIEFEDFIITPDNAYINSRERVVPFPMAYWYAFINPPYRTSYSIKDFKRFNNYIFSPPIQI